MYRATNFLDLGTIWRRRSASHPSRFGPRESPTGTHCIGSWLDTRASLDAVENRKFLALPGLKLRPFGRQPVACRYTDYVAVSRLYEMTAFVMILGAV
jgi:hypothetical protein